MTNRSMKFWEVLSAFRSHESVIVNVFSQPDWRSPYLDWLENYDRIVDQQDREILDYPVPARLTAEIAKQIPKTYYFDCTSNNLRADRCGMTDPSSVTKMTTLEVHEKFGGASIEEVQEKGSIMVPDAE